jgi:hypothetical protein
VNRSIDIDDLWRIAARKLQVSPLLPTDLHIEGLRRLASAFESQGCYDAGSLRLLQREIFAWILAYLNFAKDLAAYPGIAVVPVHQPLFVAGFGRTGSTLLHNLLALDANARTPLLWELLTPSPPPHPRSYAADSRIQIAERRLEAFTRADPQIGQIHPMAAQAPDECHWMMRHTPQTAVLYQVPQYWDWLKRLGNDELVELYSHYRLQAQHLQLFCRRRHWLSKAFTHLHFMPVLFEVFPDAKVVRLHRHPCQAIPSLCSLGAAYRRLISGHVDHREIGATILDMFVDGMRRSMAVEPSGDSRRLIDLRYDHLVADPIGTVRRIYARLGYRYGATFEQELVRYLERQQAAMRPRHSYSLEQFGLSREQVIDRSADYLQWVQRTCGELSDIDQAAISA